MYLVIGSPPLTRGIRCCLTIAGERFRFTPAHAGNTYKIQIRLHGLKVHPRSRGEYEKEDLEKSGGAGSPPLTRGILKKMCADLGTERFTPAHAGNTIRHILKRKITGVHPRSRGEYLPLWQHRPSSLGSPPLTRGIH